MPLARKPMTSDQRLLLNFLISLLVSAVNAGLQAGYQYSISNSVANVGTIILTSVTMFSVSFGYGLYGYVPTHIMVELQALRDTVNDFTQPTTPASQPVVTTPATSVVIHAANVTIPPAIVSTETVESIPEVVPVSDVTPIATVQESVNAASPIPGDVVSDKPLTPVGVTTQENASEKTQKIAIVKPSQATTPLAQG